MILIFWSLIFIIMVSKHSVLTSQGTKYFYYYYRFPFVIPILVISDREMIMQNVSGAPKYVKCATSTKTYEMRQEHHNIQSVPRVSKHTECATSTKVLETTRISLCHATLNALKSRPSQSNFHEPELCSEDSKWRNPYFVTFSSIILLCTMGTESLCPGLKWPGSGADYPPSSISRVEW